MGGLGSGRTGSRTAIENCLRLSARSLFLWGQEGSSLMQTIPFINTGGRRGESRIHIARFAFPSTEIRIQTVYEGKVQDQSVWAVADPMPRGGFRYLFICPHCGKKRLQIVMPPHSCQWSCRACYNLTYTSCNESGKYNGLAGLLLSLGHPDLALAGAQVLLNSERDRRWVAVRTRRRSKRREYEAARRCRRLGARH
jgi:hypothetical protein